MMKQKLLKILQEKTNKPITQQKQHSNIDHYSLQRKLSQQSHKLPIEMNKSAREIWLFEILNNQNLTQKARTIKLIKNYQNKEIKWNKKRDALQNEVDLLRQLLYQY
ncbi:unnamed protein product [Paramecium pentaurelia]|uniref:Uncharacterized protein n=1 Tax=Paramecium pentaurelia TaxID=43138 RepID=A0A8S1VJM9_9CILI|nr:unnamed protein product [Paramecium pentaurelia]